MIPISHLRLDTCDYVPLFVCQWGEYADDSQHNITFEYVFLLDFKTLWKPAYRHPYKTRFDMIDVCVLVEG